MWEKHFWFNNFLFSHEGWQSPFLKENRLQTTAQSQTLLQFSRKWSSKSDQYTPMMPKTQSCLTGEQCTQSQRPSQEVIDERQRKSWQALDPCWRPPCKLCSWRHSCPCWWERYSLLRNCRYCFLLLRGWQRGWRDIEPVMEVLDGRRRGWLVYWALRYLQFDQQRCLLLTCLFLDPSQHCRSNKSFLGILWPGRSTVVAEATYLWRLLLFDPWWQV